MVNRGSVNRRWKRRGNLTPRRPEIAGAAVIPTTNNNANRHRAPRIQLGESSVIPTEDNSDRLSVTGIRLGGSGVILTGDYTARIKRQRTGILLPSSATEEFVFPSTPAVYSPSAKRVIRFPKSLHDTDATWLMNAGRRVIYTLQVIVNGNDQELEIAPNQQDNEIVELEIDANQGNASSAFILKCLCGKRIKFELSEA